MKTQTYRAVHPDPVIAAELHAQDMADRAESNKSGNCHFCHKPLGMYENPCCKNPRCPYWRASQFADLNPEHELG